MLRTLPPERLGFEYADGVFRGPREFTADTAANRQTLHWQFDGHWNAAGNAFAAERLADLAAPLLAARKPSAPGAAGVP